LLIEHAEWHGSKLHGVWWQWGFDVHRERRNDFDERGNSDGSRRRCNRRFDCDHSRQRGDGHR
jgi:hypothetical protein